MHEEVNLNAKKEEKKLFDFCLIKHFFIKCPEDSKIEIFLCNI